MDISSHDAGHEPACEPSIVHNYGISKMHCSHYCTVPNTHSYDKLELL